uniref:Uncharacterized protein n=1 Tax=Ditylenchus dipsaci TaxID=166011 RepID=A0A915DTU6_9BILA
MAFVSGNSICSESKLMTVQGVMEYELVFRTAVLLSPIPTSCKIPGHCGVHVQQITDNLQLGAELVAFAGSAKRFLHFYVSPSLIILCSLGQSEVMKVFSGGFRYFTPRWSAALTGSENSLSASYHLKASDSLQFGVVLDSNFRQQETKATFAYQAEVTDSFLFRASCDTDWTVAA